ncbi:CoA pyrophosphatase [Psychroflexus sp. YR1-1]|uniref:CoA pyrophosphatase n=1 Tax=Psychroflexus aurantiacus TaxID=2709310 RepID=A0A6B3R7M5_9FLAO|nr:CoA pyrophosphatase [Psychroflexus aurantiacus]NEV93524.1 CoA pyrophosphatase [Psychroflexus aurantiacus]
MDFSSLTDLVSKLKKTELPGEFFQYQLAPLFRQDELKRIDLNGKNPNYAGVVSLLYPKNGEAYMAFILRKTYKGVHSNQIGFPGGRYEDVDEDLMQTALRETEEEIGVSASTIHVIKALTKLYIPPSNFLVHPYLSMVEEEPVFVLQESEVENLIEIPLSVCLDERSFKTAIIDASYAKNVEVPAYNFKGHVVWGATAMILSEIRELFARLA